MNFALALGWTGSFDAETGILHLATGDHSRVASVWVGPAPQARTGDLLDRATGFLEGKIHQQNVASWQRSLGRLAVGGRAVVESRSAGVGDLVNGSALGHRRRHRTGAINLDGRRYGVRHRSRWRTVVDLDDQQIAVLTRRVLSRRNRPLDRTPLPRVQTSVVTETDQLAVVLAASVMGPPGRTGFWGEVIGEAVPW